MRTRFVTFISLVTLLVVALAVPPLTASGAKSRSSFRIVKAGPKDGGGEPSIATDLTPTSPGYGKGVRIPNFNDDYAAPDMGAHQSGTPAMKLGVGN